MKPYFQDNYVTIYNADCRDVLPQLPKIDLVLTDYPYANETNYDSYTDSVGNLKRLVDDTMPFILGNSQRALITCGVANIHLFPQPDWILSWINPAGVGSSKWGFCCWQPILAYGKDPYLQNGLGRQPDIIIKNEQSPKNIPHPCPKPIDLWQLVLLRGSVSEDDIIFDPLGGSGTTCEASKKLNRKSIMCELSERSCEFAVKRLSQSVMNFDTHKEKVEQARLLETKS